MRSQRNHIKVLMFPDIKQIKQQNKVAINLMTLEKYYVDELRGLGNISYKEIDYVPSCMATSYAFHTHT